MRAHRFMSSLQPSSLGATPGYPPKPVTFRNLSQTLEEVKIQSGDTLIVKQMDPPPKDTSSRHHITQENVQSGPLMRKVVPSDNSCLFTSIGFVLGGKVDTSCCSYMRDLIVQQLQRDEETYSEAILGKPLKEYCDWISKPDSWGGAIELSVLSQHYGIEIAVVDTINGVINRFGEDKNYEYRVFLIFDGIHYDPLYKESLEADGAIQTIFQKSAEFILKEAEELAFEAKSSKQYTDVNNFTLKCLVCGTKLTGQTEAQGHAKSTGHTNFGEVLS